MQKQRAHLPASTSPAIALEPRPGGVRFRRRLRPMAAPNLYEKEREERPEARLRARTRPAPDDDMDFDGTGCFSDT